VKELKIVGKTRKSIFLNKDSARNFPPKLFQISRDEIIKSLLNLKKILGISTVNRGGFAQGG
jgi:hypothetical protein